MDKLKSRTFWLALIWTIFSMGACVCQALSQVPFPLSEIVLMAGACTTTYIGGNKLVNSKKG